MKYDKISVELKLGDVPFGIVNLYLKKKKKTNSVTKTRENLRRNFFHFTFFSLSSSTVGRKLSFRRR